MQTIVNKRSAYQLDVLVDSVPEATIDRDNLAVSFPYGPETTVATLREASKSLKGSGPVKAMAAIQKAIVENKPGVVQVIVLEGEEALAKATAKPAKAKKAKKALKTTADGLCLCGCGAKVTREFLPGHDARYKGQLIKNVLAAEADPTNETIAQVGGYSLGVIQSRNWMAFLNKSRDAAASKAARKSKVPSSIKKGHVVEGPTVNLKQLAVARDMLKKIGRYGESAGDRQISPVPNVVESIIDGTHPDLTDEDKVELGFAPADQA